MSITEPSTGVRSDRPKIRIIIADDHLVFRDCLCRLLALEEDLEVIAQVSDGEQVADALRCHEPDILLLDLNMPGSNGFATLQTLQAAKNTTRVIVLTGSEDTNDALRAVQLGSSGVVLKQTATEVLADSIRRVYAGKMVPDSPLSAALVGQCATHEKTPAPMAPLVSPKPPSRPLILSQREREIVALVGRGFTNKDIAEKLSLSEQTVKNHLHSVFHKLGIADRLELALYALNNNLI